MSNKLKFFVITSLIFLTFSLGLYLISPEVGHFEIDSYSYNSIANNFVETGFLGHKERSDLVPLEVVGYPLFLGLIYKTIGYSLSLIIFLQVLLSIFCGYLIFNISNRYFGYLTAKITLILFCLNLGFLVYSQLVLAEVLLVTFLLLFFDKFLLFLLTYKFQHLVQASIYLSISVFFKPAALFFSFVIVLFIFLLNLNFKNKIKNSFLFLLIFFMPISFLAYRNYKLYDSFEVAPVMRVNLFRFFLPKLVDQINDVNLNNKIKNIDVSKPSREDWNLFVKTITNYPILSIKIWLQNNLKTFLGLYSTQLKILLGYLKPGSQNSFFTFNGTILQKLKFYILNGAESHLTKIISISDAVWMVIRILFIFIAIYFLISQSHYFLLLFLLAYVLYFIFITGADGTARLRMMIEPQLIMLTALGIVVFLGKIKSSSLCKLLWSSYGKKNRSYNWCRSGRFNSSI